MSDREATEGTAPGDRSGVEQRTCRAVLGVDCVLPLNHEGRHVRQHEFDLRRGGADG